MALANCWFMKIPRHLSSGLTGTRTQRETGRYCPLLNLNPRSCIQKGCNRHTQLGLCRPWSKQFSFLFRSGVTSIFISFIFFLMASPSIWSISSVGTLEMTPLRICGALSAQHHCISPPPRHRAPWQVQAHATNQPKYMYNKCHKNSYHCQHSPSPPATEATGRVLTNLSGHPVRPQWKQSSFTVRQTFTPKAWGLFC